MAPCKSIRRGTLWLQLAVVSSIGAALWSIGPRLGAHAEANPQASDLVVHEWGTFLGMNGSDGASLDGMYHEEHALPAFVHSRTRDQLRMPGMFIKGETPVIYFYGQVRQRVHVAVGFPRGIWTQWYPQANRVRPSLLEHAEKPDRANEGRICWEAEVIPASQVKQEISKKPGSAPESEVTLPETSSDALWNHAREVDAAFVKTVNAAKDPATFEFENFLFYRGLGEAKLPLQFDERRQGTLTLEYDGSPGDVVRDVFVVRVENGRGAYSYRKAMRPGERVDGVIPSMDRAKPLAEFTRAIAGEMATRLAAAGLYAKEARAMVNTWTTSYFQTEGVRVLFVLPQSWTDAFIPLEIAPQPKQVIRVMVGRLELLTAQRERLAENAVRCLGSRESNKREGAFRFLHEQGRYVEPIVRRILRTTKDDGVRTLCRRLLLSELVTDLRAAVHNAADGKRLNTDPLLLRAQLARVLREVGLNAEARSEGNVVLSALKVHPTNQNRLQAAGPAALEIRAAALEAIGDDRTASRIYARRVELEAQAMKGDIHPNTIARLRDWSIGRAYARCVSRCGRTGRAINTLERTLAVSHAAASGGSDHRAARMLLAYLLEEQGKPVLAEAQWSSLGEKPKLNAAGAPSIPTLNPIAESGREAASSRQRGRTIQGSDRWLSLDAGTLEAEVPCG
jgi:hypothetical protein